MTHSPPEPIRPHGSLLRRLFVTAAAGAALTLILAALSLTWLYRQTVMRELDDRLAAVSSSMIASLEITGESEAEITRPPLDPRFEQVFSGRYWQVSALSDGAAGDVLASSRSVWDARLEPPRALIERALAEPGDAASGAASGPDGEPVRILVRAVRPSAQAAPVLIIAAENSRPAARAAASFALTASAIFGVFMLLLAGGIIIQVRVGLAPVLRMKSALSDVREGAAERIEGAYPRELLPLAGEINALLDHSSQVVERARTHVGNLAHALKTPLTVLSNALASSDGPEAEAAQRQVVRMQEQIDHHLRRARAAANARGLAARAELAPCLDDLSRTLMRMHAGRSVQVEWDAPPDLTFRGERQDLDDMIGNLLDNACKWAASRALAEAAPAGAGRLEVRIDDDGPGMPEDRREDVLGRGVRLDERTPGDGLGLSIVADLTRAYGGEIALEASPLGGLRVRLVLPSARRRAATQR